MAARAPILPPPDLPPLSGANVTLVEYSLGILNATTSPTRAAIPHALKTNLRLAHTFWASSIKSISCSSGCGEVMFCILSSLIIQIT